MYPVGGLMIGGAGGIQTVEIVFLLLLVFVAMFAGLARRLKVPYPILLVIAGLRSAGPFDRRWCGYRIDHWRGGVVVREVG